MKLWSDILALWKRLGRVGQVFAVALALRFAGIWLGAPEEAIDVADLILFVTGMWLAIRAARMTIRGSIWRLRNRLIVAYLFVALVPIVLIAALALVAVWALSGQLAVYLVTSELNRRIATLRRGGESILREAPPRRAERVRQLGSFLSTNYPGLEIVLEDGRRLSFPEASATQLPDPAFGDTSGLVSRNGEVFAWAHFAGDRGRLALLFPLTTEFLSGLVPQLGSASTVAIPRTGTKRAPKQKRSAILVNGQPLPAPSAQLPAALNALDLEVFWASPATIVHWNTPKEEPEDTRSVITVRSRISSVARVMFSQKADWDNSWALILIYAFGVLFLAIELVALAIGVSLSRSITNAVHNLYEGTERVMEGDFSHRIRVKGRDQLAQLSSSFNRMTERVEQLLAVAKEKERIERELEIAREIQKQLYPRSVPESSVLSLTAYYKPARMVSGDYYDYRRLSDTQLALAIGDVAGKGISAALLMATIQSGFRGLLQQCADASDFSPSKVVAQLNQQLHANTPPEKFATFVLGIFDEGTGVLHSTNAGHLQPILVRRGEVRRLEVDGMVIGAFPFAKYGESTETLEPGDLLVYFTDGISEPENEYGEMFGEDRLADLVLKHAHRPDAELIDTIVETVNKWTGSEELQDDMTLLVARRS
ncbi:MAG: PP2C family protein-serine/threonine phosphatase [Bryobacteraceae bacterium]|nr:PP2C family protein-serine/threonine phosphatase [Bryobacteraceae bacterium]